MRKPGRSSEIPPPLELACLKALWRIGQGSVRDVRAVMAEDRSLAYTTVMTVLDRLSRRGAVARRKSGRAFVYEPVLGPVEARKLAIEELVKTYFGGSMEALQIYLNQADTAPGEWTPEASRPEESLDPALL